MAAIQFAPTKPKSRTPLQNDMDITGWGVPAVLFAVLLVIAGVFLLAQLEQRARWARPESRRRMIEELTGSLQRALRTIDEIRRKVDEGSQLLCKLEEETQVKSRLARLSSDDAAAVIAQMKEITRAVVGPSTWVQVGVAFFLFILGAVTSWLIAMAV